MQIRPCTLPALAARVAACAALPVLLVSLGGCAERAPTDADGERVEQAAQAVGTCNGLGARWVGTDAFTGTCADPDVDCLCPVAAGWDAQRTFRVKLPGALAAQPLPPLTSPYCSYTWGGGLPPQQQDIVDLQGALAGQVDSLTEDCVVLSPHAAAQEQLAAFRRARFVDEGRQMGPLPMGLVPPETIEVSVLDSSPSDASGDVPRGALIHGHVMGWTVHDLTCEPASGKPCLTHVSSFLALRYVDDATTDDVQGGAFGTRLDLAKSLFEAVETWKQSVKDRPRLVLPLALGWDPVSPGGEDLPAQIVHEALRHAACHGALAIAAAGNEVGGPIVATDRVYPAAWEDEAAPTAEECAKLEGAPSGKSLLPQSKYPLFAGGPVAPAPLVLSIGATDAGDGASARPIAVTRPGSVTRLTALGFQAEASDGLLPSPLPHTGTSTAAMVAGAAAAAAWAYAPELTAAELVEVLEGSATPLSASFDPTACLGGACTAKQISLCEAIHLACATRPGPRCPAVPVPCGAPAALAGPAPSPVAPGVAVAGLAVGAAAGGAAGAAVTLASAPVLPPSLGLAVESALASAGVELGLSVPESPWREDPGVAAGDWVAPQPIDPGCGVCVINLNTAYAYVTLDATYLSRLASRGTTLSNLTLTLDTTTSLRLSSTSTIVSLGTTSFTRAQVSWRLTSSTGSVTSATESMTLSRW